MKYKSCHLLEHGIAVNQTAIEACCIITEYMYGHPTILKNYRGEKIDWHEILKRKRESIKKQQQSEMYECQNCSMLVEKEWEQEDYISHIHLNHWSNCNSNCVYCSSMYHNNNKQFDILPDIKELVNLNLLKPEGELTFQGGEPTLLKEFDEIIEYFLTLNIKIRLYSSGIKYSEYISKGLKEGILSVTISPDAGNKELYKKIKRVDCFETVWNNIEEYAKNISESTKHLLTVKYIILPGYNDSIKHIDEWLLKVEESGAKSIATDVDFSYLQKNHNKGYSEHITLLMNYMKECAEKKGLLFSILPTCTGISVESSNKNFRYFIKCKPIYKLIIHILKKINKSKNIDYERKTIL